MKKVIWLSFLFLSNFPQNPAFATPRCDRPGALILAHGSHHHGPMVEALEKTWNESVEKIVKEVKSQLNLPIELAFGMWDREAFQKGVDILSAQGICELRIIPFFINSNSEIIEIQKYMFGLQNKPNFEINVGQIALPKQIKKISFKKAFDSHPIISQILTDRVGEISKSPTSEALVLIGHGPLLDQYEPQWLESLQIHGQRIQNYFLEAQNPPFESISHFTLRDDSISKIRNDRTFQIRKKIKELNEKAICPLIVPVLIAKGGIDHGIEERLKGLNYTMINEYLVPHTKIKQLIIERIFE